MADHIKLSGHFIVTETNKTGNTITVELWLEEDGFFRLKFEEKENGGHAINDEKGRYEADPDDRTNKSKIVLAAQSRDWTWKDSHDGDSGTDSTDLKYPCHFKSATELEVQYLENVYLTKKV